MARIVECIPNFSEGRDAQKVQQILDVISAVPGVKLLDHSMNADHNRSVVTFIGEPEKVLEAAFAACSKAAKLINMEQHHGEHPRIGATDVIPFVPISEVTMADCVEMAKKLGERIGTELQIPVYLYEEAATRPERRDLAYIRKGQYEALKAELGEKPEREPDFGPAHMHHSAGATVVGARMPLVAFNINLGTSDISIAKRIAKLIRARDGGYMFVKAMGVNLDERHIAQVSINMINFRKTSLYRVFETVKMEAERYGVPVVGSEIIGLVPMDALIDVAEYYLRIENFDRAQILESRLTVE
ncbi:MAG TPA: glutamate formimidoyltransferase [Firmicutes bacterium]|jgi:glutamate formiminotransferase|nr:glutamate formimidoyltransferase [Bacillota bacterium]HBG44065.1 glutamate formimidoyltransferase [Bacillota bacterium]